MEVWKPWCVRDCGRGLNQGHEWAVEAPDGSWPATFTSRERADDYADWMNRHHRIEIRVPFGVEIALHAPTFDSEKSELLTIRESDHGIIVFARRRDR